ncbi:hypothetical protein AB0L86_14535 [Micromonospora musae]|uniref:hypothetical protein n=1 Tax=Micromonospora musae TaxID=1894970 RepID=UPI0034192915
MPELSLLIEPSTALPAERVDALAAGLADDLRSVRGLQVAHAQSPTREHGKSQQAWELGMLIVGGVFSATTMRALTQIAIAYADRAKARSITLRSGGNELVITGNTRVDQRLVDQLAHLMAPSSAESAVGAAPPAAQGSHREISGS